MRTPFLLLRVRLFALALLSLFAAVLASPAAPPGKAPRSPLADDIFAGTNVLRIQIEIPPEGIAALEHTGFGNSNTRPVAKAIVREGGVVYTNVAIHLKGSFGSFRSINDNPALTLSFTKFGRGQSFHGLHKFSLNNSVQDPTFLCEKICRELFADAGVPAPRAGFATLELNGRNLGMRVLVEGFNKQFLARSFTNALGTLYENHGNQDVTDPLEINSSDTPADNSGLAAIAAAVTHPDPAQRWTLLTNSLDLDRFLSFMAMEVIVCHWDGYCMNRNNFRLYHALDSNKMVFIGHGMDQMFGSGTFLLGGKKSTPDCPILPRMDGAVAKAVLANPDARRLYRQRVSELSTNVFRVNAVLQRIDALSSVILPVVAEPGHFAGFKYITQVARLKELVASRGESLARQIAHAANPASKSATVARTHALSGWRPQLQGAGARLNQQGSEDARVLLHIDASARPGTASWRASVQLEPGNYRFVGRVRAKNLEPAPAALNAGPAGGVGGGAAGAGLRISGQQPFAYLTESADWREFSSPPFEVGDDAGDTTVVCELRSARGEVWFDQASLKIVPAQ